VYLSRLVDMCDNEYASKQPCDNCKLECTGMCGNRVTSLYFGNVTREYDCPNMVNFYVCKYGYRYVCEIQKLWLAVQELRTLDKYRILSIGCGPCTDLLGILGFLDTHNPSYFADNRVEYVGIDYNPIWKHVHQGLVSLLRSDQVKTRFVYKDLLELTQRRIFENTRWKPNVLLLQYAISDMTRTYRSDVIVNLVRALVDNFTIDMPKASVIVLNDINHNTRARDYYEYLYLHAGNLPGNWKCYRYYFDNLDRAYSYVYGDKHSDSHVDINVPGNTAARYGSWTTCASAQMVLVKEA
jgi:hypothetical protein